MPSVAAYRRALEAIDSQLNEGDRGALAAHAAAPGRDLDVVELSAAAGEEREQWTYARYGQIGRMLAEEMRLPQKTIRGIWTRAIGEDSRDPDTERVRWVMHAALAAAVRKMPWGRDPRQAGGWGIGAEHVRAAFKDLDQGVKHPFHDSTGYDLVYQGRRYPPKAVLGLAAKHASGIALGPKDFSGGEASSCFRVLRRAGFKIEPKPGTEAAEQRAREAEREIEQRIDIGPTKKERLIQARRGQGVFRRNLQKVERRCRVTGTTQAEHLRASHIKPWVESDDFEKLDGHNGILLAPHVDHLFDQGFISFEADGRMVVSPELDVDVLERWGINPKKNHGGFKAEQAAYLEYHRKNRLKK